MAILAAGAIFLTVFVFFLALAGADRGVRSRLDALWHPSSDEPPPERLSVTRRTLGPFLDLIVSIARRVMPKTMLDGLQQRLILAGEPMTLNAFLALQVLMGGAFLALPIIIIVAAAMESGPLTLLLVVGFAIVGFALPHMWLRQRVNQRRNEIIKSLPDAFDLITTCVEAGLGLDAALSRVSEKVQGPFADELRRTLREIGLGKLRREALRELADRTDVPDLAAFVNAVIQAEEMGSSVGTVLRVQAEQLRTRRRQRAEEQAQKAPVKMIFPLVLCIFPTLFIVILGPAVITIMTEFGDGGP